MIEYILKHLNRINLEMDLWKSQNILFRLGKKMYRERKTQTLHDQHARDWVNAFEGLSDLLIIKII